MRSALGALGWDTQTWLGRRVRRPADIALLILSAVALTAVVGLSAAAVGPTDALEHELTLVVNGLPALALSVVSFAGGAGALVLPVALGVDFARRGRLPLLIETLAAAGLGAALAAGLEWLIQGGHLPREAASALTRPLTGVNRTAPLSEIVVATTALLASSAGSVRIHRWGGAIVLALAVTSFLGGDTTAVALVTSVLLGLLVGFAVKVALGRPSTRATTDEVAQALAGVGVTVGPLTPRTPTRDGVRRFVADMAGRTVHVTVFDRDALGSGVLSRLLRLVALRPGGVRAPELTLRAQVEHAVLMGQVLDEAGVPAPRPLGAAAIGDDSVAVAWAHPGGVPLAESREADGSAITRIWHLLATLQDRGIAHRSLTPTTLLVTADGDAALAEVGRGDIAASDLALRLDVANLLATTAIHAGAQVATRAAVEAVGLSRVRSALPVLQPVALDATIRSALKEQPGLLGEVQDAVVALSGEEATPPGEVELRRVTPRTVLSVVGGAVAAYVLLGQLSRINLRSSLLGVNWAWGTASLLFAALTFAGTSLTLTGAAPVRLRFPRTVMTQLAIAFSGLVAPALLGNIALNTRYLRRSGPAQVRRRAPSAWPTSRSSAATRCSSGSPASQPGSVPMRPSRRRRRPSSAFSSSWPSWRWPPPSPACATGPAAGSSPSSPRSCPRCSASCAGPRSSSSWREGPSPSTSPSSRRSTSRPGRRAPRPRSPGWPSCTSPGRSSARPSPLPGGLGGIEAALTAGLIAVGTDASAALSAVLLYRVFTYWLPIPLGWVALHHLQRSHAL